MKRSSSGGNNNTPLGARYQSYQSSTAYTMASPGGAAAAGLFSGYQPPIHYASDQTKTLEDSTKVYYEADGTAGNVLQKMTAQRQQLEGAHDNVWEMRQATEAAKRELKALQQKYRQKRQKLYIVISLLSITDLLLFLRLLQCRGSFFC